MALWFKLNVNDEQLGTVEIRRRERLDTSDPAAIAGVWSTYDVRRDGRLIGQVRHVYGHGAWHLLSLVSGMLATDDLARRSAVTYSDRTNAHARLATQQCPCGRSDCAARDECPRAEGGLTPCA